MSTSSETFSVVIPVYNEEKRVLAAVAEVRAIATELMSRFGITLEIIIIDDGSTDGTAAKLAELAGGTGIKLFKHSHNRGKGAALRKGFAMASGDVIGIQDADLEYPATNLLKLLQPIMDGEADVVYGSRYKRLARLISLDRWIHLMLNVLTVVFTWKWVSDMETCQKLIRREFLQKLQLFSRSFTIEPELTIKLIFARARLVELPIDYVRRSNQDGKKIRVKDLFKAIFAIVLYGCRMGSFYPRLRHVRTYLGKRLHI